jgi:maltose alpha-D-glucosyltransferase/alpha-amylase
MKLLRRIEDGPSPAVELGRFLWEKAHFSNAPAMDGSIEYKPDRAGAVTSTLVTVEEFTHNECDGWQYAVDALRHSLEEALAHNEGDEPRIRIPRSVLIAAEQTSSEPVHPLLGPHETWAPLLGKRIAELHLALAGNHLLADFAPEPITTMDRQAMFHGARSLFKRAVRQLRPLGSSNPYVARVLDRSDEILDRLKSITSTKVAVDRIRCHGDLHLGQVLWTGRDFVIIDFEGEPARSIGQRRLKRPAFSDVAGMIRSFSYASRVAASRLAEDLSTSSAPEALEPLVSLWYTSVSGMFLRGYLDTVGAATIVPSEREQREALLDFHILEKAIYELGYEASSRPDWVSIPAQGILEHLDSPL